MLTTLFPTSSVTSSRWESSWRSFSTCALGSSVVACRSIHSRGSEKIAVSEHEKNALNARRTTIATPPITAAT